MKNLKNMKTVVLMMTMDLVMIVGNLNAQYEEDKYGIQPWFGSSSLLNKEGENMRTGEESAGLSLPLLHGSDADSPANTPLGSGIAVLVGFGAAYLMGKKRKKE